MWPFKRRPRPKTQREIWEEEQYQKQLGRAKTIEKIANRHLDSARLGGPNYNVKEHVLISYEDLLKIWDLAGRIREDL